MHFDLFYIELLRVLHHAQEYNSASSVQPQRAENSEGQAKWVFSPRIWTFAVPTQALRPGVMNYADVQTG